MNRLVLVALVVGASVVACLSCHRWARLESPPGELVGRFEGQARIIVAWCEQDQLRVAIDVHADGRVSGRVGDAVLVNAFLSSNRGAVGRALGLASDWIVVGDLDGPLVAAEDIVRDGVKLPLALEDGRLVGGLHSTGVKLGSKDHRILSATDLVLERR